MGNSQSNNPIVMSKNMEEVKLTNDKVLEIEDFEPEADLPESEPVAEKEISDVELKKQKARLAEEWSNFSGVEMPKDVEFDKLSDEDLVKVLYDNLMKGVDTSVKEIGFDVNNDLKTAMDQEADPQKKSEIQKQFIDSILKQTRSIAEGGKFNRGKEDTWAFYPAQIAHAKRLNCSGATLVIGRILENSGFQVDHGIAAHHAVSVVKLADGHSYYVDSRRNRNNIIALEDESKPIGGYQYQELHHPQIAYEKIITVPKEQAEIEVIIGNYNSMRQESKKPEGKDNEAKRQISEMDEKMKDIDFGMLWDRLFPQNLELHTEIKEWLEEEKRVDAKHKFSDQLENAVNEQFGGLTEEQKVTLTGELQQNGQKIYEFCSDLGFNSLDLKNNISEEAYKVVVATRDILEGIRGQSQAAYEFALAELKGKILP